MTQLMPKLSLIVFLMVICFLNLALGNSDYPYVTWGSVIKLLHKRYNARLHSHDIKYGSGSGQQSVTGTDSKDDVNSHWVIKPIDGKSVTRGEMIECGAKIVLEHMSTGRNLHSHHFSSPLSRNQEVSCFGEKGVGDTGDYWEVICSEDGWRRDDRVRFKHIDTHAYLGATNNKYGRPIHGQHEIVATTHADENSYWQAAEGMFMQPNDFLRKNLNKETLETSTSGHQHIEL